MCGIAGIIGRLGDRNRAALERMNDAMVHRGPDASGTWVSAPDSRLGRAARAPPSLHPRPLARRRSADGGPGDRARDRVQRRDLQLPRPAARALSADGQELRSTGDTAVMLRALGLHGSGAVGWLRGMFAFACWDPKERRLLLARDPLGMEASLLGAVVGSGRGLVLWPSPRSFARYWLPGCWARLASTRRPLASAVWNGFVVGPGTAVKGVDLLWPGRLLEFDGAGREVRQGLLADPDRATGSGSRTSTVSAILDEGLRLHLASDVPLASLTLRRRGLVSHRQLGPARGPEPPSTPLH